MGILQHDWKVEWRVGHCAFRVQILSNQPYILTQRALQFVKRVLFPLEIALYITVGMLQHDQEVEWLEGRCSLRVYILSKEPYIITQKSPKSCQNSPAFSRKSPAFFQKSPTFSQRTLYITVGMLQHDREAEWLAGRRSLRWCALPYPERQCVATSVNIYNSRQTQECIMSWEVGGWGRDPKKCTGRDWGMGSSTI